jgi:hypothetical protein
MYIGLSACMFYLGSYLMDLYEILRLKSNKICRANNISGRIGPT